MWLNVNLLVLCTWDGERFEQVVPEEADTGITTQLDLTSQPLIRELRPGTTATSTSALERRAYEVHHQHRDFRHRWLSVNRSLGQMLISSNGSLEVVRSEVESHYIFFVSQSGVAGGNPPQDAARLGPDITGPVVPSPPLSTC